MKSKTLILSITIVMIILAIIFLSLPRPQEKTMQASPTEAKLLAGTISPVYEFTAKSYQDSLDTNKIIILYFYAEWCPICKAEIQELYAAFETLNDPNVVALRVNYRDSNTDKKEEAIAKEFGITYQHTKVILKNGVQVLKSGESWNKERYSTELATIIYG